jgi:hypothetical protein
VRTGISGAAVGLALTALFATAPSAGADLPSGSTTSTMLGDPPPGPTTSDPTPVPTTSTTSAPTTSTPTTSTPGTSSPATTSPGTTSPATTTPTTSGTAPDPEEPTPRDADPTTGGGGSDTDSTAEGGKPADADATGTAATGTEDPGGAARGAGPGGSDSTGVAANGGTGGRAAVAGDPAGASGSGSRERRRVDDERPVPVRVLAVRAAVAAGGTGLLAVLAGGTFFAAQGWIDRRDPKLALSPLRPSPPLTFPTDPEAWTDVAR